MRRSGAQQKMQARQSLDRLKGNASNNQVKSCLRVQCFMRMLSSKAREAVSRHVARKLTHWTDSCSSKEVKRDLTKAGLSQGRVLTSKSQNTRFMPYPFSYPSSYPVIVHSRNARILLWSSWLHWEQDTVHTGVLVWDALEIRDFLSCLFFHCNDPPRDAQGACVLPVSSSVNSLPTSLSSSRNSKGNVPTLWQENRSHCAIPILQNCIKLCWTRSYQLFGKTVIRQGHSDMPYRAYFCYS